MYALRNEAAYASSTNVSMVGLDRPSTPITRSKRSSTILSSRDQKRLSLQTVQSRSFQKGDSPFGVTSQQKGYKVFHPGIYEYSFEIALDHTSPETIELPLGSVKWTLEALVERAGTFKSNLHGSKEVTVIRAPDQNSLEQVEPIAISRKWEDQLHYDIVISGKSFAIGSKIPIAFKLTPLAKVQCHRIKVYITENIDYYCKERKVTRKDVQRKILLLEKQAGKPLAKEYANSQVRILSGGELSAEERERARALAQRRREIDASRRQAPVEPLPAPSENLLGDLDLGLEHLVAQTEIEMEVQLPTCACMRKDKNRTISPDTTWKNIQVHHWIKVRSHVVGNLLILTILGRSFCVSPALTPMTQVGQNVAISRSPLTLLSIFFHVWLLANTPPCHNIQIQTLRYQVKLLNVAVRTLQLFLTRLPHHQAVFQPSKVSRIDLLG